MKRCEFCFERFEEEVAFGVCPHCGYHEGYKQKDPRYLPIGTVIHERYIVGGVVGDGGFGITYRVWDKVLNTTMALKEYYQSGVVNRIPGTKDVFVVDKNRKEEFLYGKERLLREARIVSQFQTSVVIKVNDFFEENGTSYMVMEFLKQLTLEKRMKKQNAPFTPMQVTDIGRQLCEALSEINAAGVIHRDIAPDNIFITDEGVIKLIDFGSARLSQSDNLERLILVKEGFSPIEQYEAIDFEHDLQKEWTDIYALGATMYYCLTGEKPLESRIRKANIEAGNPDILEPIQINKNIDENLNNIIMKAMAIDIHERFQNAEEMLEALKGDTVVLPLPIVRKRKRRIRAISITCAFLAAALVIMIASIRGKLQYDDVVLEPASVSVWYCIDDDDTEQEEKSAMEEIIDNERNSEQFKKVNIELKAFSESEYEDALNDAYKNGTMPTIFECVNPNGKYLDKAFDVSAIIDNLDSKTRACWFLDDYKKKFAEMKCIPTGFNVPVIYLDSRSVPEYSKEMKIASMSDIVKLADGEMIYKPIALSPEMRDCFNSSFDDFETTIVDMTVVDGENFINTKAAVYLSSTGHLGEALQVGSNCKLITLDVDAKYCRFENYWSMSKASEAQNEAGEVLLAYMFTDNAQDRLYLQTSNKKALPVNKNALSQSDDIYSQLHEIIEDCKNYIFE